jgi:hypothetical protein
VENIVADPGVRLKLIMLFVLIYAVYKPIKSIILGRQSLSWRKIHATVITSNVDRESGAWYPNLIYKYVVGGKEFVGDLYTFAGASTNSKSKSLKIVDDHPVGSDITVYVHPEEPSKSVVVPGVLWQAYANVVFFVVFLGGIAFIVDILNFFWPGCKPHCV